MVIFFIDKKDVLKIICHIVILTKFIKILFETPQYLSDHDGGCIVIVPRRNETLFLLFLNNIVDFSLDNDIIYANMNKHICILIHFTYLPKPSCVSSKLLIQWIRHWWSTQSYQVDKFFMLSDISTDMIPFIDVIHECLFSFDTIHQVILFCEKVGFEIWFW